MWLAHSDEEAGQALARLAQRRRLNWLLLVKTQPRVRRVSGPLLLVAKEQKFHPFDKLRGELCLPTPAPTLVAACSATENTAQSDSHSRQASQSRKSHQMQVLTKFGIATLVIGGLTGLAYLERDGPAGQAIAIGSGVAFGATLGVGTALFAGENPYEKAYLALPLALLGAVGGGVITGFTSSNRGDARFGSAAVPSGGVWLVSLSLAIDAL